MEDLPPLDTVGVIGFVGRSNVGKSSLINRLTNRRHLAKVGRTPGKTTLANLYALDRGGYFLDLPGYGYMKRDKVTAGNARILASLLIEKIARFHRVLLLVDVRRGLLESDQEALFWLMDLGRPVTVVLSKSDLVTKNDLNKVRKLWENLVCRGGGIVSPQPIPLSTKTGEGLSELTGLLSADLYSPDRPDATPSDPGTKASRK